MSNRKCLRATEGHIYTNGEIYNTLIYLAEGESADAFYEISVEEYRTIIEQNEAELKEV